MKPYCVRFYMKQHVESSTHLANLEAQVPIAEVIRNKVQCESISLGHSMEGSILHLHAKEFNTWASFANLDATAKHEYWKNATEGCWYVRSKKCLGTVEENISKSRQVCKECQKLILSKSIVRAPLRFARKYHCAKLLHARIFETEQDVQECIQDVQQTAMFQRNQEEFNQLMNLDSRTLQEYVRNSFVHDSFPSEIYKEWVDSVVKPALRVNISAMPAGLQEIMHKVNMLLVSGRVSDQVIAELKVASAAISGSLSKHPILMGLALQSRRLLEKQERGLSDMRGRRSLETDYERSVIADAGQQLALAAGQPSLAREFGLAAAALKIDLAELEAHGLPNPGLAILKHEALQKNFELIDQKIPRGPGSDKCIAKAWRLALDPELKYAIENVDHLMKGMKRAGQMPAEGGDLALRALAEKIFQACKSKETEQISLDCLDPKTPAMLEKFKDQCEERFGSLQDAFEKVDLDGVGIISREDFRMLCHEVKATDGIFRLLEFLDPKRTGEIRLSLIDGEVTEDAMLAIQTRRQMQQSMQARPAENVQRKPAWDLVPKEDDKLTLARPWTSLLSNEATASQVEAIKLFAFFAHWSPCSME
eukprot:Skav204814  [mRNA]  locus=scaffold3914:21728:41955:- [translate_table: standard]